MKLPEIEIPGREMSSQVRACINNFYLHDPALYADLFLEGISSKLFVNISNKQEFLIGDLSDLIKSHLNNNGLIVTEKEYDNLDLGLLEKARLIISNKFRTDNNTFYRLFGLFQIYPLTRNDLGLREPIFLVNDFPGPSLEDAVFPTYIFRTQFEYHLGKIWSKLKNAERILDIGSGGGGYVICCAKICNVPKYILGIDNNPRAVLLARFNINLNGADDIVRVEMQDLFNLNLQDRFDIIISNPPYLALPNIYARSYYSWGYAGDDGLRFIRAILERARDLLKPEGILSLVAYIFGGGNSLPIIKDIHRNLQDFSLTTQEHILPPSWVAFNELWFAKNPINIDDLYLRVRQYGELEIWKKNKFKIGQHFIHNVYIELKKNR